MLYHDQQQQQQQSQQAPVDCGVNNGGRSPHTHAVAADGASVGGDGAAIAHSSSSTLQPGDSFEHRFDRLGLYCCRSPSVPAMRVSAFVCKAGLDCMT